MSAEYVGDGVYVEIDAVGNVVLTTHNGYEDTNNIVLEPDVFANLLAILDRRGLTGEQKP